MCSLLASVCYICFVDSLNPKDLLLLHAINDVIKLLCFLSKLTDLLLLLDFFGTIELFLGKGLYV
jgi:hypothetical protein